jgi:O-antigen ligase
VGAAVRTTARGVPANAAVILALTAMLSAAVLAGSGRAKHIAVLLVVYAILGAWHRVLLRWPVLLTGTLLVILFLPIKKYQLPASLPVDLEPYRLVVALLIGAWLTSLLIDDRVRWRASGFEGPIVLIVVATLGSELANPGRFAELSGYTIKALSFFASFVLMLYLIVSLVDKRSTVDNLLRVLACGGAVLGLLAMFERATTYNVFDHLEGVVPMLAFQNAGVQMRDGSVRAMASSAHPIELSVVMTMLLPFAAYLALSTRKLIWWAPTLLLVLGNLATGSRTGFLGLVAVGAICLWLRPRETFRFWPALIPAVIVMQIAVPGALGGIKAGLQPSTLISEQHNVVEGNEQLSNGRLADLGPSLAEYAGYNPLFGQGFGTRVTGFDEEFGNAAILDNQWLKTLLETGLLGVLGWLWLIVLAVRRLARRAKSPEGRGDWLPVALAASITAYGISMLTYDAFSFIQGTFLLYVVLALSAVVLVRLEPR